MNIVLIACSLLILQTGLSFIQITYYKRHLQKMARCYSGYTGYNLYSAMVRKKLGLGVIALIVVDNSDTIKECQILKGFSIFSKFNDLNQFKNQNLSQLISKLIEEQSSRKLCLWEQALIKTAYSANR